MNRIFHKINRSIAAASFIGAAAMGLSSCSAVYDDLEACPEGVELRFVYDYNMEYANAFPSQVDCLTLLIYDEAGKYIKTVNETSSVLADENWRMIIDLPAGHKYRFVAYGGLECDKSSFHFVETPDAGSELTSLEVAMDDKYIDADPGLDLHNLFYGNLDLEVPEQSTTYTKGTVYMLRDTNSIRILLQNSDGTPINADDFDYVITANNTLMGYNNDVIPTPAGITYYPWAVGQNTVGSLDNGNLAEVAYAEFSIARLISEKDEGNDKDMTPVRLEITDAKRGNKVFSIPLVNYLLALKSERYKKMENQEYLDRENRWDIIIILQDGRWTDARIIINDWDVRINNVEIES